MGALSYKVRIVQRNVLDGKKVRRTRKTGCIFGVQTQDCGKSGEEKGDDPMEEERCEMRDERKARKTSSGRRRQTARKSRG